LIVNRPAGPATALLYPEPERGKRTDLFRDETSSAANVPRSVLSKVRAVLRDCDEQFEGAQAEGGGAGKGVF
jgi:hypothetical protein